MNVVFYIPGGKGRFLCAVIASALNPMRDNLQVCDNGSCHAPSNRTNARHLDKIHSLDDVSGYNIVSTHSFDVTKYIIENTNATVVYVNYERNDLIEIINNNFVKYHIGNNKNGLLYDQWRWNDICSWFDDFPNNPLDITLAQYKNYVLKKLTDYVVKVPEFYLPGEYRNNAFVIDYKDTHNKERIMEMIKYVGGEYTSEIDSFIDEYANNQPEYMFGLDKTDFFKEFI